MNRLQPVQDLVAKAVQNRPELAQTQLQIENAKISLVGDKSQLLPSLNLVASAQNNGLAGEHNSLIIRRRPEHPEVRSSPTPVDPRLLGNFNGVWGQILGRNFPDYTIGFQLSVPIRNRAAQADIARDQLTLRQNELRQRQQLNQIRVDVQNAIIGLQQSRARYQSAQKSRVLQEQTLDAEQKKYALGASTIFFVIQAQRDLAAAQGVEVAALSTYNRARVQLDQATGDILTTYNVSVDEAMKGSVSHPPRPATCKRQIVDSALYEARHSFVWNLAADMLPLLDPVARRAYPGSGLRYRATDRARSRSPARRSWVWTVLPEMIGQARQNYPRPRIQTRRCSELFLSRRVRRRILKCGAALDTGSGKGDPEHRFIAAARRPFCRRIRGQTKCSKPAGRIPNRPGTQGLRFSESMVFPQHRRVLNACWSVMDSRYRARGISTG